MSTYKTIKPLDDDHFLAIDSNEEYLILDDQGDHLVYLSKVIGDSLLRAKPISSTQLYKAICELAIQVECEIGRALNSGVEAGRIAAHRNLQNALGIDRIVKALEGLHRGENG